MRGKTSTGFTLIEMMVVVAIIAIIAAVALPSYTNYVLKSRRADGREMLMRVASAQEKFYTNRNRYGTNLTTDLGIASASSEQLYYSVGPIVVDPTGQTFTLTAVPQGAQVPDKCGSLTVNNLGVRGFSGAETNGRCW